MLKQTRFTLVWEFMAHMLPAMSVNSSRLFRNKKALKFCGAQNVLLYLLQAEMTQNKGQIKD